MGSSALDSQRVENAGIVCHARVDCPSCKEAGAIRYDKLRDRLFRAPGEWRIRECKACDFAWLDPLPEAAELGKLYSHYYTHSENAKIKDENRDLLKRHLLAQAFGYPLPMRKPELEIISAFLAVLPGLRDFAGGAVMWLPFRAGARLLDIGSGSGEFPKRMRELGWQVSGVETDPAAAKFARETYGLDIRGGDLVGANFSESEFHAITLSHVIEHVPDPQRYFQEIFRLLRPGGIVSLVTPNWHSRAHRKFAASWRGLEIPRHLQIFSQKKLLAMAVASGLQVKELRTVSRTARNIWWESKRIENAGEANDIGLSPEAMRPAEKRRAIFFQIMEEFGNASHRWGEELLLLAEKP